MTTAYTSLLGLALPVTGELSGTWGDTVNNSITSLLDAAIAGTTTLSTDADVTLSNNDGTADTSRQAILLWTAGGTVTRTVIAPALSKIYTVINASSSTQSIKVTGPGPTTGVTIIKGEAAMIAWNGSDFVKVSNTGGSFTTQDLTVTGNTILGDAITDTTTLNAQTRFQSRAILGYANMTGPASTSLSTTAPAFLYSGATTYTVSDVSGGTQTFAPIISLGQAIITNASTNTIYTNAPTMYIGGAPSASTNVRFQRPYALYLDSGTTASATAETYTNAATLYIAGAPTAGANVTLTTPHALYVNAGTSYFADNVGIGTSSPQGPLDVARATTFQNAYIRNTSSLSGGNASSLWLNNGSTFFGASDRTWGFSNSAISGSASNLEITYWNGSSYNTRAVIDSSGNLGLGVTPNAWDTLTALQIKNGSIYGFSTSDVSIGANNYYGTSNFRYIASSVAAGKYTISGNQHAWYIAPSGTAGNAITFTQAMTLDASGNLGIGTTSTTNYILRLNAASPLFGMMVSGTQAFTIGALSGGGGAFYYGAGNAEAMRIDSSGNLGIGTSSPDQKLVVKDVNKIVDGIGNVFFATTNSQAADLGASLSLGGTYVGTSAYSFAAIAGRKTNSTSSDASGYLAMYTTNPSNTIVERARINSSGNLGVGVTPSLSTSNYRTLQIGGSAKFSIFGQRDAGACETFVGWNVYGGSNTTSIGSGFYYVNTGDSATLYSQNAQHAWFIAPSGTANNLITFTQAMTLDASGNLLVGATSSIDSTYRLQITGLGGSISTATGTNANRLSFDNVNTTAEWSFGTSSPGIENAGDYFAWNRLPSGGSWSEFMRLDSSGNLLVGQTVNGVASGTNGFFVTAGSGYFGQNHQAGTATGTNYTYFGYSGSVIGSITQSGTTAVLFNVTSDKRLKTVTSAVTGQGARIDALKPIDYQWKESNEQARGFLAHEFQEVYPSSVSGNKDAVDAEGKPMYQAMQASTSEVMADLVAEIQSLRKRLAAAGI